LVVLYFYLLSIRGRVSLSCPELVRVGSIRGRVIRRDESDDNATSQAAALALGTVGGDVQAGAAAAAAKGRKQGGDSVGGDGLSSLVRTLALLSGTTVLNGYIDGQRDSATKVCLFWSVNRRFFEKKTRAREDGSDSMSMIMRNGDTGEISRGALEIRLL
jgi:hypothetical protein